MKAGAHAGADHPEAPEADRMLGEGRTTRTDDTSAIITGRTARFGYRLPAAFAAAFNNPELS
jgi:hypothetical protein